MNRKYSRVTTIERPVVTPPDLDLPMVPEPVRILTEARKYLADRRNWLRGQLHNKEGQVCSLGAIMYAAGYKGYSSRYSRNRRLRGVVAKLAASMRKVSGLTHMAHWKDGGVIAHHNDHVLTHEQVLKSFDDAIETALKEEK